MPGTDETISDAPARPTARRLSDVEIKGVAALLNFGFDLERVPDVMPVTPAELEAAAEAIKAEQALILARAT